MSQNGLRIVPFDKLENLNCFNRLKYMRQKIEQKFRILKNEEIYVEIPKSYVNSVLFALFVKVERLNKEKNKKLFEQKVRPKDQEKIRSIFQKISKNSLPTSCKQGEFVKHVRTNMPTLQINEALIETSKQVWDQLAPNEVSNTYGKAYFKQIFCQDRFDDYPVPNSHEQIKRAIVVQFQQTKDSFVLCFLETQKPFVKKQIDQIMEEAMTQKFQIKEVQREVKPEKSIRQPLNKIEPKKEEEPPKTSTKKSKQLKDAQQTSNQTQKEEQKVDLKQVQKQLKNAKPRQEESFFSFATVILLVLLSFVIFQTWTQHQYYQQFSQGKVNEFTFSPSASQQRTIKAWKIFSEDFKPLRTFFVEGYQEYLKPGVESVCEMWEEIKTDPTVTAFFQIASDDLIGTLKAVKTFVDGLIFGSNTRENRYELQI